MEIVQSKLQECISKGGLNSLDKIAAQLGTNNMEMEDVNNDEGAPDIEAFESDVTVLGKDPKKIPKKVGTKGKISFEINKNKPVGQYGSHLERKKQMKGSGKIRPPQLGKKRSSSKKKRFHVSF